MGDVDFTFKVEGRRHSQGPRAIFSLFSKLGGGNDKAYTKSHPGNLGFTW